MTNEKWHTVDEAARALTKVPDDELRHFLERVVPDPRPSAGNVFPLEELQRITDVILYGTETERAGLETGASFARMRTWRSGIGTGAKS